MNTQLVYPMTTFKGFADNNAWMQDNLYTPFQEAQDMTKDQVFAVANTHRTNLVPIFADESKYLPTNAVSGDAGATVVTPVETAVVVAASVPTQTQTSNNETLTKNQKEMYIVDGIIIAVGIVLLAKIIS